MWLPGQECSTACAAQHSMHSAACAARAPQELLAQRAHRVADVALDVALLAAVLRELGDAAADELRLGLHAVLVHDLRARRDTHRNA